MNVTQDCRNESSVQEYSLFIVCKHLLSGPELLEKIKDELSGNILRCHDREGALNVVPINPDHRQRIRLLSVQDALLSARLSREGIAASLHRRLSRAMLGLCQASRLPAHSVPLLPSITSSLHLYDQSLSLTGSLVEYACPLELHIRVAAV